MYDITNEILSLLGKSYTDIAKKAFRHIPEISYGDLIYRILESHGVSPLADIFPEMSRIMSAKILAEAFPEKDSKEHWFTYLLSVVNKKHCCKCGAIKLLPEFHDNANSADGKESACKLCRSAIRKDRYLQSRDKELEQCRQYKQNNAELIKEKNKLYYQTHKPEAFARSAKRRAAKRNAAVAWANPDELKAIYNNCPEGYHVDHIIPLKGELVCGLHVEHNLQYLTAEANLSKGNRFDIDNYTHATEYVPPYSV